MEGFAEFFAGVEFKADGHVVLGAVPAFRIADLIYAREVPIRQLLDFDGGSDKPSTTYDSFYGQSWVLFHYVLLSPDRKGQMSKYQELLARGQSALDAAQGAFGDLEKLDSNRKAYLKRRFISSLVIDPASLNIGSINVRKLRAGEAAMIESRVGVSREEALACSLRHTKSPRPIHKIPQCWPRSPKRNSMRAMMMPR